MPVTQSPPPPPPPSVSGPPRLVRHAHAHAQTVYGYKMGHHCNTSRMRTASITIMSVPALRLVIALHLCSSVIGFTAVYGGALFDNVRRLVLSGCTEYPSLYQDARSYFNRSRGKPPLACQYKMKA